MKNSNQIQNKLKYASDSFFYNNKNRSLIKQIGFVMLFILGSLFVSLIIIQMLGYNMIDALNAIFTRPFQSFLIKDFITNIAILGLSGLAFSVAYKAGIFNIGISGQMVASGLSIVALSQALTKENGETTTGPGGIIIVVIVAMLTGMFVSMIIGALKVYLRVHEVVSSILLNWIIFFLAKWLIVEGPLMNPNDSLYSSGIHEDLAFYDSGMLSGFVGALVSLLVVAIIIWAVFKFTIFGKQMSYVGKSLTASKYSGFKINELQLSAFAISGAISGILACVVYTANATKAMPVPLVNMVPLEGFNGIAIGLIAFSNPIAILPVSFIMALFSTTALAAPPFPNSMGNLILGLVMYGTSIFALAYKIQLMTRIRTFLSKKLNNDFTKKWDERVKNKNKFLKALDVKLSDLKIDLFSVKIKDEKIGNTTKEELIEKYLNEKNQLKNNLNTIVELEEE
ncbi:MAG: ABC transporter permease [Mycoplasmoidaceae bacterium]